VGTNVVVTGAVGAVGRAALAVARRGGAAVIATVRRPTQIEAALAAGADEVIDTAAGRVAERILAFTGEGGVDRVAEVAFDANLETDLEILRHGGVIATYASGDSNPAVPFGSSASRT
jgi:NADPH:quinone reductase